MPRAHRPSSSPMKAFGGAGLGLRRTLFSELDEQREAVAQGLDFVEAAPENWIGVGGRSAGQFHAWLEHFPLVCHGLSLSLGGVDPLDIGFLKRIKAFLDDTGALLYSEHLSFSAADGQLYHLLPIPFTAEAVDHVAMRIRTAQDVLERRIAVENVSCYATFGQELDELGFVNAVLEAADCDLLLDVNNIAVNSVNFGYDAEAFLDGLPGDRVAYIHVAGHRVLAPDLRIDNHGAPVSEEVWALLERAYRNFGVKPTLLERDMHLPPVADLLAEVGEIRALQGRVLAADAGAQTRVAP